VSLGDLGESTEVVVAQGPFAAEHRRALHVDGWTDTLDRLHDVMASAS
jgi:uncharacterized protein YndB with AHSA1/START domain